MQHHVYSIRETSGDSEDVRGAQPGGETFPGRGFPVVHGRSVPSLPLRGAPSEVRYQTCAV